VRARTAGARLLLGANLAVMALLLGGPVLVLVERSLHPPGGYGLTFYRALGDLRAGSTLFVSPTEAIANSLRYAAIATVLAVVVGGCGAFALAARRNRGLDTAFSLPLGVSAVTVGFGFLIALDHPPLDLRSSPWLVPVAQAMVALPLVVRTVAPVLRAIDDRQRQAAASLGAGPVRVLLAVDLPVAWRSLVAAAGFAFAVSLGEFGATSFVVRDETPTLPIVIYRLISHPGAQNAGMAMAASVLLAAATAAVMLAVERLRVGSMGTF
jgi:thiamine transport system permease protein